MIAGTIAINDILGKLAEHVKNNENPILIIQVKYVRLVTYRMERDINEQSSNCQYLIWMAIVNDLNPE